MEKEYWIPGRPATFATSNEVSWKETMKKHIAGNKNVNNLLHRLAPEKSNQ